MSFPCALHAAAILCAALGIAGCARQSATGVTPASPASGCIPGSGGSLQASVRGALVADIDWSDAQMECDGGPRPDGKGMRIVMVGPLPPPADAAAAATATKDAPAPRQLRFIFGIDLNDTASGPAQVLPTNLTLIVEGEGLLFATRGDDRCAVEDLIRTALADGAERVSGRGYCLGPASDLSGETRILLPTFTFTALVRGMQAPAATTL